MVIIYDHWDERDFCERLCGIGKTPGAGFV
jgi:hypothetical protein